MSAELLKNTVEEFMQKFGVEFEEIHVTGSYTKEPGIARGVRTVVAIRSPFPDLLIGPQGEHLRALNLVLRKIFEQSQGESAPPFLVDVNDHYEQQMEKIRADARLGAQRVRLFKHEVEMSPMNAYERLVVHELFAEDREIKTESAGEGKFRHIVLKYQTN